MKTIASYTRKQALEDETLFDVSTMAKEAGIRFPVAISRSVWFRYIQPDKQAKERGESAEGRLWDLCYMLARACRNTKGPFLTFEVIFSMEKKNHLVPNESYIRGESQKLREVSLNSICGPGDNAEPVLTVMLPNED